MDNMDDIEDTNVEVTNVDGMDKDKVNDMDKDKVNDMEDDNFDQVGN